MVNALTRKTGLTLGPIILETLLKHYFERISHDHDAESTKLRKEELLYDEAFNIVKSFMEAATKHTVEELQAFSNTRTPSPPWVQSVRLLIPMSCCDEAATHLIKTLGGEQMTKRLVGGTKWWQVRGIKGIDAEWIVAKKDWQEAKRRQKAREASVDGTLREPQQEASVYQVEMDPMRCILYAHGGGYYFGSLDQERYSIQRLARKINGRVFAINYRLAPQYPFPCAIQDFLAAYLYLIQPPPGSQHAPVSPLNIVFGGDSAGGGLCLATLQVVRDAGLPLPAGAVLISPWCDLTHSFPSIHLNTATDIIPQFGLSFHKPSTLWPPPPDELTKEVHRGLRRRIWEAVRPTAKDGKLVVPQTDREAHPDGLPSRPTTPDYNVSVPSSDRTLHLGGAGSLPLPTDGVRSQRVALTTPTGETLEIDSQVHMYAPNYLLTHPFVSPVVSYLGGLPPLLVIAGDKEVLRDEIIYLAHKAAYPDKYPVKPEARALYPPLEGIEQRHKPTKVHLQVYDDCAHTLPMLFAFTTPGKYCFRAMATFIKHVTPMPHKLTVEIPLIPDATLTTSPMGTTTNLLDSSFNEQGPSSTSRNASSHISASQSDPSVPSRHAEKPQNMQSPEKMDNTDPSGAPDATQSQGSNHPSLGKRMSVRRVLSAGVTHAGGLLRRHYSASATRSSSSHIAHARSSTGLSDVAGPRFHQREESIGMSERQHAGEPSVYDKGLNTMMRERISTHGVVRPLESESELSAFRLPPELIGEMSELAVRRYVDGTVKFGKKFGKTTHAIEKTRRRNLERASQDTMRNMSQLHTFLNGEAKHTHEDGKAQPGEGSSAKAARAETKQGVKEGLAASGSWPWAWALDEDENPPPSSIVSRRDTEEARRLAKIADQAVLMDESAVSGNNLWSLIVNFLTVTPDRDVHKHHHHKHAHGVGGRDTEVGGSQDRGKLSGSGEIHVEKPKSEKMSRRERIVSSFARFVKESRKSQGATVSTTHNEQ